jgi:hypothetical protein
VWCTTRDIAHPGEAFQRIHVQVRIQGFVAVKYQRNNDGNQQQSRNGSTSTATELQEKVGSDYHVR